MVNRKFVDQQPTRTRSKWWHLLPIFFNLLGGVIAYFAIRHDDPKKAKNCLWIGIILTAINISIGVIVFLFTQPTELSSFTQLWTVV